MSVKIYVKKHINSLLNFLDTFDFNNGQILIDEILNCKGKIFFTGIGKNGHVACKASSTFSSIGLSCFFINPVDSLHGDMGSINKDDILVAVSKSGNTEELINFLNHVKKKECKIILLHSNLNNDSLKFSNMDVYLPVSEEADHMNIIPSNSISIFTVFLQSVACEIAKLKEITIYDFIKNHPGGSIGRLL